MKGEWKSVRCSGLLQKYYVNHHQKNHKIQLLETMFTKLCNYDTLTWYGPHYICFHWNVLQSCLVRATSQYSVGEGGKMSLTLPNKCFSCIIVLLAHLAKVTNYQSETNQTYGRWLLITQNRSQGSGHAVWAVTCELWWIMGRWLTHKNPVTDNGNTKQPAFRLKIRITASDCCFAISQH